MNKQERQVIKLELTKEQKALDELEKQYRQALRDIEEKIRLLQSDELTQSRIYQLQYQQALRGQVAGILDKLRGDQYATIQQYLHDSYQDGFIGTMYSIHGQGIPLIVPLDQNAAVKAIITDSKIEEGLYASLGVNIQQLKKAISTEITRGIAGNLPFADIARNITNRSKAPLSRAKTIVRTEAHRIQQAAAADARNAAKENGCEVVKQWDGTLDGDTRPTHRRLDGQIRETEEPFEMDGKTAMYPGDFGKPEEDCNCRCVALTRAKWALDEEELETLKKRAEYFGLDKSKEFEEYREKYLRAVEQVKEEPKTQFVPAKTKGEAVEYAKRFAQNVSYDGLTLENANKINERLATLTEKYPIRQLDEIVVRSRGVSAMTANHRHLIIGKNNLGKTLETEYEFFLANQEERRKSLQLLEDRWAGKKMPFSIQRTVEKLQNGLRFNRYAVQDSYAEHVMVVVTHEYGHILSDQYFGLVNGASANPNMMTNWSIGRVKERWRKLFERAITDGDVYGISEYGATDEKEFFAECFAAREFGEKLPDYIEEFMGEVLKNGIL
jgi:hypothetical protein